MNSVFPTLKGVRLMRPILIAIATLLSFTFAVKAQIAAPRLHPTFPGSLFSANPAVLSWSRSSHIGGGFLDISVDAEIPPSPSFEVSSGDGFMMDALILGGTFSIGADALSRTVEDNSGGGSAGVDTSMVGLALNLCPLGVSHTGHEVCLVGGASPRIA